MRWRRYSTDTEKYFSETDRRLCGGMDVFTGRQDENEKKQDCTCGKTGVFIVSLAGERTSKQIGREDGSESTYRTGRGNGSGTIGKGDQKKTLRKKEIEEMLEELGDSVSVSSFYTKRDGKH